MQVGGLKTERLFQKEDGAGSGGGTPTEDGASQSTATLNLTDKQLEAKINEVYNRASRKTRAEMEENVVKPLQAELEKFKELGSQFEEFFKANKNGNGSSKGDGTESSKGKEGSEADAILPEQLQQILSKKDEEYQKRIEAEAKKNQQLETQLNQRIQESKRQALEVAAAKHGAIEPSDIAELLMRHIEVDKGTMKFSVLGATGSKEFDNNGEPLSLESFVQDYLNKRPHQVKSDFKSGSGSSGGQAGNSQGPSLQQQLKKAQEAKDWPLYIAIEQELKKEGLKVK